MRHVLQRSGRRRRRDEIRQTRSRGKLGRIDELRCNNTKSRDHEQAMRRRQHVERPKHLQEPSTPLDTSQLHFLPGQPHHHVVPLLEPVGAAHSGSSAVRRGKVEQDDVRAQRQIPTCKLVSSCETAERESRTGTGHETRSFKHLGYVEHSQNAELHV